MKSFSDRLIEALEEKGTPAVVGLDPQLQSLPPEIKTKNFKRFGKNLKGAGRAILEFNRRVLDVISPHVGVVKLQIAFYEALGPHGIESYRKTVRLALKKGLLVIGDIKRGDVGHTAEAYARAHLGEMDIDGSTVQGYGVDAVTLNPYLGSDSIMPFLKMAKANGKGVFIVVKSTNPSSKDFQDRRCGAERLCELVARKVNDWGSGLVGKSGYSAVGAVVAVTSPGVGKRLRRLMPRAFFLVPGYGAQGAKAEDMRHYFDANGYGVIISSSRSIIFAYENPSWKKRYGAKDWERAVEDAVIRMRRDISRATGAVW
ncbi:MAG: orotidine-5'-phosphate decarboxylase [Candidatus Brocadiales bacterium]|nr:orotidine-5'-phosphate decarboxylase [Candidatus Bathyanammoxibius amoris]